MGFRNRFFENGLEQEKGLRPGLKRIENGLTDGFFLANLPRLLSP